MAQKKIAQTRVEYWENYRETIKANFEASKKSAKKEKSKPVKQEKPVFRSRKVTRAEALINEYERKNGNSDSEGRKDGNNLLLGLAIIGFLLIVAGIIFMVWRYRG